MIIEIKNQITSEIIFEYEKENNTKRDTILEAIKEKINLRNADLSYADLRNADLSNADLRGADLRNAALRYADLSNADLSNADLRNADLSNADLSNADLSNADLKGADLRNADLSNADLRNADLRNAALRGADLRNADLSNADLRNADLSNADLRNADLRNADLSNADLRKKDIKKIKHLFQIIPEQGSFIAWKKLHNQCIAKIEIPTKSPRICNLINRKCRAKFVKTLDIIDNKGNSIKEQIGQRDSKTIYKVGRLTHADSFDNNMKDDCSHGIHFFVTKQEALNW